LTQQMQNLSHRKVKLEEVPIAVDKSKRLDFS
jgi:hypothetical protein